MFFLFPVVDYSDEGSIESFIFFEEGDVQLYRVVCFFGILDAEFQRETFGFFWDNMGFENI